MRFTNKFPYTNINNINLDWIIRRVKELGETVRSYANDIANAVALAEAAQDAADSVTGTAESAVATAQAAEATANAIAGTANSALATAQAAENTAQAAETTANAIAGTANSALSTAQAANATAQAAEESADNAETIAGTASANASNAVQTANTALATAQSALSIASQFDVSVLNEKAGKLVDTKTGAVVSFIPDRTIEQDLSVSVAVEPLQAGSGDPTPDNVRNISGRDSVNIMHSGADTSAPVIYRIQIGQTVYGSTLDVINGTLTVDILFFEKTFGAMNTTVQTAPAGYVVKSSGQLPLQGNTNKQSKILCNVAKQNLSTIANSCRLTASGNFLYFCLPEDTDSNLVVTATYPITTPITIQLDPVQIAAFAGQLNNVWSDAGNVTVEFAADLKWYIDSKIAELQALVLENGG